MLAEALRLGREDYVTILYLARYAGLRIHECFRIDTAIAAQAVREGAITIKGKGGLVRTVPLHPLLVSRLELHLQTTPRGHKLFVPDDMETHTAIQHLQAFIRTCRPYIQDAGSARPMTFHGLRHVCAAEWYQERIAAGATPYEARKAVSRLLGHGRDDVTKIYLASLRETRTEAPLSGAAAPLLVWIILFKLQFSISDLDKVRSINFIPFHYDTEIGAAFHLTEVLENFLIFVPMGIYLQMLLPRTKLYVKFMLIAGTSFLLETMQYILAVGRSDITDVLTNTAGGLLGLAVYSMAARLIGNRIKANRLFSILAGIVSVVVIGLLGFLLFANR